MAAQRPLPFGSMTVLETSPSARCSASSTALSASERPGSVRRTRSRSSSWASGPPQPVSSLNLHQLRFLELAKALAGKPRVLLLDEVMAGLNDSEVATSVAIVRNVRDELGVAILWVEHVMSAVMQLAERAIVLNFGHLLAEGVPEVVMRDPQVVDAYLGQARVA